MRDALVLTQKRDLEGTDGKLTEKIASPAGRVVERAEDGDLQP